MKKRKEQEEQTKEFEAALLLYIAWRFELVEKWLRVVFKDTTTLTRMMTGNEIAYTEKMFGGRWATPLLAWEHIVQTTSEEITNKIIEGVRGATEAVGYLYPYELKINWSGIPYDQRAVINGNKLYRELITPDPRGLEDLIRQVQHQERLTRYEAIRLIRNEAAAVDSMVRRSEALSAGETHYRLDATLDNRTSQTCLDWDGTILPWEGSVIGESLPPFHPWCRTVAVSLPNRKLRDIT